MARARRTFATDAVKDQDWFSFPDEWYPGVRFLIRRAGVRAFQKRIEERMRGGLMGRVLDRIQESGATLADMRDETKAEEVMGGLTFSDFDSEELLTMLGARLDFEGIGHDLIVKVEGGDPPMFYDTESDEAVKWQGDAEDIAWLEDNPHVARWALEQATDLQAKYDAYVEGAVQSLDPSSAPLTEEAEALTSNSNG